MGAMSAYGISYLTGSPWLGVLAAGIAGALLGALHAGICSLPRVNDIAIGIALMLFGTGPRVLPRQAADPAEGAAICRRSTSAGGATSRRCARRCRINVLFLIGVALAPSLCAGRSRNTRWGLIVRIAGESADAARAMGYSVDCDPAARHHGRRLPRRRSAARSCRSTIPAAGTRACPAGRA